MVRRAIIKHDGTRREENIWHWWTGAGRTSATPRLPPPSSLQERLVFDLRLSAAPLQISLAKHQIISAVGVITRGRSPPALRKVFSV